MQQVIGYVRVSTTDQAEHGVSLEAQRERIAAWCSANGFELAGVFVDAGISGKRADNRPELQAALDAVCSSGGVLIVYSLSRLARSTKDTITISERLEKAGADLVSLSERIDTTSAAGKMVFRMLAVLSEFERDLVSERTRAAMQHKRARNEKTGGSVPFGFDVSTDGVLIENEDEQQVIGLIRDLRASGESYQKIADELTSRQVLSKEGKTRWHKTQIARILTRAA